MIRSQFAAGKLLRFCGALGRNTIAGFGQKGEAFQQGEVEYRKIQLGKMVKSYGKKENDKNGRFAAFMPANQRLWENDCR